MSIPAPVATDLIELNVPVQRDENGHWANPGLPDFDGNHDAYYAWRDAQGIETQYDLLEHESDTHPAYIEYYENGGIDISAWHCVAPTGDGWQTLAIFDSEDGPVWVWVRRPGEDSQ